VTWGRFSQTEEKCYCRKVGQKKGLKQDIEREKGLGKHSNPG